MNLFIMQLHEFVKIVTGLSPRTPASDTPRRVTLKNAAKMAIVISVANASSVTGSAISLHQAKDVDGTAEKALLFGSVLACLDAGATDAFTEYAVMSGTFTTDTTANKELVYLLEIEASS